MIRLVGYSLVKGGDGKIRATNPVRIQTWSNEAFYEKFDIFDEKEWGRFITQYRKNGKRLAKRDAAGNLYAYTIIAQGTDQLMRQHFEGAIYAYLFPQETSMRDKTQKLIDYNRKYIDLK